MHRQATAVAQRKLVESQASLFLSTVALQHLTLIELMDLVALLRPAYERVRQREASHPG